MKAASRLMMMSLFEAMMMIPKDVIEAAARALYDLDPECIWGDPIPWGDLNGHVRECHRRRAIAALAVAIPLLWHPLPPKDTWLRTRREGEDGENVCSAVYWPDGTVEWVERDGGRTTVTHHSFAAPTHWRLDPVAPSSKAKESA